MTPIARAVNDLVADNGWTAASQQADVHAAWPKVVGPAVAEHAQPGVLREGILTVNTSSTAWATQLRILAPSLQERIDTLLGPGIVAGFEIHGPQPPSWRAGPRRVPGRGPRDTYG